MKKNLYIQPKTELLQTGLSTIICAASYGGETPDSGMRGDAPARRGNPAAVMYI